MIIATITSLLSIILSQLNIIPAQSQIINLSGVLPEHSDLFHQGNLETDYIQLDGKILFQIATPSEEQPSSSNTISPIERRVNTIQFHLSNIVRKGFDPNTLKITISTLNNQTVLFASDKNWGPRYILTVTPFDVELDEPGTIDEVAQRWSKLIEQALLKAREQRQSKYQKQQIPIVLIIIITILIVSYLIRRLQKIREQIRRRLEQQQLRSGKAQSSSTDSTSPLTKIGETSSPSSQTEAWLGLKAFFPMLTIEQKISINVIVRRGLKVSHIVLWLFGLAAIFSRFPQTRAFANWLLRVPLAYLAIPLGMALLKSVVDALLRFYLKHKGDEIKEKGYGDIRLRPRFLSIYSILEELTSYLAVVIGFLLFCYVIKALPVALIILTVIAFISQNLLQSLIKTYFILVEDQYALGDSIQIGEINGSVEKISLINSQIRTVCGDLYTISHGSFTQVANFTHRNSGINLFIDVAYSTDIEQAMVVIEQVAQEMQRDSVWGKYLTGLDLRGVETFGNNSITIRLILMTEVGKQWRVANEYRRRLKPSFDRAGISIPFSQSSIWFKNALITSGTKSSEL